MVERIDNIVYQKDGQGVQVQTGVYYNGPAEFLVQRIAKELLKIDVWTQIFGDSIDGYKRMDYAIRQLPAMRIYNNNYTKESESWFIVGQILVDIILPASLRRNETQQIQDTLSGAVVQQFRRPGFFETLSQAVPGLNELGRTVDVDKSLGFEWEDTEVPLTQIILNFRLDLRQWDLYLEETNRTKDSPFEEVLGDLTKLVTEIRGLKDDNQTTEVTEDINQDIGD